MSIALPVHNGADTLVPVIESVLAQTCPDVELVISDNASTDGTQEICRDFASRDRRVVYRRHEANVGLLNNFISAARTASGAYLRWIGDSDFLEPDFVARVLEVLTDDPRLVLVTTEIVYRDDQGGESGGDGYDPSALAAPDPVDRFAAMLRLLTAGPTTVDPLYGVIRRDVATMPRKNMMREDQVFATRLALAGPWGHVAAPLAVRTSGDDEPVGVARLLDVPTWRRHVRLVLQCREMSWWVGQAPLDPSQRRRARAEILRFYARSKQVKVRRGVARLERVTGRPDRLSPSCAP